MFSFIYKITKIHSLILVCPAGWRPGADTIIPNPEEKLKYFSKNYETKKN